MKSFRFLFLTIIYLVLPGLCIAQVRYDGIIELDSTTYDFGPVREAGGPVECSFHLKNISEAPVNLYNISVTCDCTTPSWSKEPIAPGEGIDITVRFNPFAQFGRIEKSLHLYVTGLEKPVEVKIKGSIVAKSIEEKYYITLGPLFVSDNIANVGTIHPGASVVGSIDLANPLQDTVSLSLTNVPDCIKVIEFPKQLKGREEKTFVFTVAADSLSFGYRSVTLGTSIDGEPSTPLRVDYNITLDFSGLEGDAVRQGPRPRVSASTEYFTDAVYGQPVETNLKISNAGGQTLIIHSIDAVSDAGVYLPDVITGWTCDPLEPGEAGFARLTIDTAQFRGGEIASFTVVFTTNSPLRPQVPVQVKGFIEQ